MVVLTIFTILLLISTCLFAYVAWHYGKMLLNVEDNTQIALDIIDRRYHALSHIVQDSKLLNDDEVVKRFLKEVEYTRNDVLTLSQALIESTTDFHKTIGSEIKALAPENEITNEEQL